MSGELAVIDRQTGALVAPVVITTEQIELIRKTIAADATDAELQLFFYDCKRRGVHPLDKLIHFTKRQGKYTPVTAIDFFRSRAAETREHVGTEDAIFEGSVEGGDLKATVTVYRMVSGERCAFTATARWSEYCPDRGNDFMWKKMPYGQLAKCAEALALRKGFPQELDGLYTSDEMEQAGPQDAPRPETKRPQRASEAPKPVGNGSSAQQKAKPPAADHQVTAPVTIKKVKEQARDGKDPVFWIETSDSQSYSTFSKSEAEELRSFEGTEHQVCITYVEKQVGSKTFRNFVSVEIAEPASSAAPSTSTTPVQPELTADDLGDFGGK